jgi:alkanesulfonate monooxygenase SsuD/methylene tetrahydromethanopterin reductase-like flavin-dependent oxidoreductase (luciferase family)
MDAGILLTAIYGKDDDPARQVREHRELVQTAEQLGFTHMAAGQHYIGTELRYYQPIPYLAAMAQAAPSLKVVTHIMLLAMAKPVDMAEQMATLDAVTGGRAIFGCGLGYSDREFLALGIDPRSKVRRFEMGLDLIKRLWSGVPVTETTEWWQLEDAQPSALPVQQPRMPIWIGGQSTPAIKRAARMGDAWCVPPFPDHDALRALVEVFNTERDHLGLPPATELPVRRELLIAKNRAEARDLAAQRSELRYRSYASWGLKGENTMAESAAAAQQEMPDPEKRFLLGSTDEIVDQLSALREDIGMTAFMFKPHWPGLPHAESMRQLELFGTEVLPKLRS